MKKKNYFNVINPFNGDIVGESPNNSREDITSILNKVKNYKCELSGIQRFEILQKSIRSIQKNKKVLSELISLESGLCIKNSLYEVERAINCIHYCAVQAKLIDNIDFTSDYLSEKDLGNPKLRVFSEPLNLVIGITPFNHPLNMVMHKVGPAIAAGTPIIIKPSEKTPLTAIKLRKLMIESGLPKFMFNIVSGLPPKDIVDQLISYPSLDFVSFTGGVDVGKYIARKMAKSGNELTKYAPELGGNAVFVVMDDCDIDLAAELSLGAFENSGQRCTAIRKILLHKSIYDGFIDKFVQLTKKIKYGDPLNPENDMGTVISSEQASLIHKRVNKAINEGANLLFGNKIDNSLLSPTIVHNVNPSSELVKDETFGPVVSIIKIKNIDDAIHYISNDRFALASGIATTSKDNAHKLYSSICVGQFSWNGKPGYRTENAPFGGFKDSGNGEKEGVVLMTKAMRRLRTFYEHSI
jgi:aldehyde dehydrogenase (NAD+)